MLTVPLTEARAVVWPFNPENRGHAMGELVDEGRLKAKDLLYAINTAHDAQVRAAARTLLVDYLRLPATVEATRHGGPRIVPGSRYLANEERWSFATVAYVAGMASTALIILAGIFVNEWFRGTVTIPVLIAGAVLFVLFIWEAYTQGKRSIAEYEGFKRGREGEDVIAEKLQVQLDGQWTVFRNLVLPGDRKDDLDFVLVGPGGIWVLEVKTYAQRTRVGPDQPAGRAAKLSRGGGRRAADRQAANNAARLKEWLGQRGVDVRWVNAALLFPDYRPVDFMPTAAKTEVWPAAEIDDRLAALAAAAPSSTLKAAQVVEVLSGLTGRTLGS